MSGAQRRFGLPGPRVNGAELVERFMWKHGHVRLTARVIAMRVGLHVDSARVHLTTLVQRGMVERRRELSYGMVLTYRLKPGALRKAAV